uniref:Protein sleepless n=1 Tax=Acrobeloides nanus TaxID=290746 RepID=A0A914ENM8_9BILA
MVKDKNSLILLFVINLSVFITISQAHKCYECDADNGDPCNPGREILCPSNENACKTILNLNNDVIERGCIESEEDEPEDCVALEGSFVCVCYENFCNKDTPRLLTTER